MLATPETDYEMLVQEYPTILSLAAVPAEMKTAALVSLVASDLQNFALVRHAAVSEEEIVAFVGLVAAEMIDLVGLAAAEKRTAVAAPV